MKPGLPFDTLLDIATRERDACARRLAELREFAKRAADRLRLLENHYATCSAAKPATARADGAQIRNERAFLARLETAIRRQAEDVRAAEQRADAGQLELNTAERRLRAYGQLQHRADQAQALVERKRDQHQMDEFAARSYRNAH